MLGNIRAQPIGGHTVADLNLPEDFLRRVADRIIRDSFLERHRVVVGDGKEAGPAWAGGGPAARTVRIVRASTPAEVIAARRRMPEGRPPLPGFRATLEGRAPEWPIAPTTDDAALRHATEVVAKRLAFDGLAATSVRAIEAIGASRVIAAGAGAERLLREAGIPTDLLAFLDGGDAGAFMSEAARALAGGAEASVVARGLASRPFRFRQTVPGFRACSESGETEIQSARIQITGGSYWGGRGAGGSLDVLRQLLEVLPRVGVVASVEEKHLAGLLALSADWPIGAEQRVTIIAEPLPVSQWAQDNGKPGHAGGAEVLLVPRYASRGEDGAAFVPGETFLSDGLAAAGVRVEQSPLLFQGGNLMASRDPATGERILLAGEAEVYRNTTLGINAEQATEALRVEFGADRCIVLPAASFHIDFEICTRESGGRMVAFVNDRSAAVRIVLECGIEGLVRSGVLRESNPASKLLRGGQLPEFVRVVGAALAQMSGGTGAVPESHISGFSDGPGDMAAANFQAFLLAFDLLVATLAGGSGLSGDRHASAYLAGFRRQEATRRGLIRRLEDLGWRVVKVPSLSAGPRGPSALNGIHGKGHYLMPAWGGFLSPLDAAAAGVFRRELGEGVEVVPIVCGESQRRSGGVHCGVSVAGRAFGK